MNACIFSTMNIEMKRTIKMQKLQNYSNVHSNITASVNPPFTKSASKFY